MNYLGRPVFDFPVNWASEISRAFTYDLREVSLGFSAEIFTSRQQYVVNGWTAALELITEEEIDAVDTFFNALSGRLLGFWIPVPFDACKIVGSVDATGFDIEDQGLRNSWASSPDKHLFFSINGTQRAAKIAAVADNGNGTERVTLESAIDPAASPGDTVSRLHYVRLAEDIERMSFPRESHQQRPIKVIELPHEYSDAELAEASDVFDPIYLYHFFALAPIDNHWFYTSFASDVISADELYKSAAITHGNLKQSTSFQAEALEIRAAFSQDHPLSLYLPFPLSKPIHVEVFSARMSDPEDRTLLFSGTVRKVSDNGQYLTAQCDSFLSILSQRIPAMLIKKDCDYQLFEQRTCKAIQAQFQSLGEITAIDNDAQPPTVEMNLLVPTGPKLAADYFAQGWLETGRKLNYEERTIFRSTWDAGASRLTLIINGPLIHAQVGQQIFINPGCDGLAQTCKDKFDNFIHFPGFIAVPKNNPNLTAIENHTAGGDKK